MPRQPFPVHDRPDGARRRNHQLRVPVSQHLFQWPRTPQRMLPPQPKNQLLDLARRLVGMPTGRATALLQPRFPARPVTLQNRVAGRPRDPVYPAKLAHRPIPGLEVRQKLLTLLHHSAHSPRHASLLHAFANGPKSVNQLPGLICKVSARSVPPYWHD